jgi:hypothetical protein
LLFFCNRHTRTNKEPSFIFVFSPLICVSFDLVAQVFCGSLTRLFTTGDSHTHGMNRAAARATLARLVQRAFHIGAPHVRPQRCSEHVCAKCVPASKMVVALFFSLAALYDTLES